MGTRPPKEWIRVSHHALQNRATAAAIDGDAAALNDAAERMEGLIEDAQPHPELVAGIQSARGFALVEQGCLLRDEGRADEARDLFDQAAVAYQAAVAMTPPTTASNEWAKREQNLARAYLEAGRYEDAIEHLELALVLKNRDRDVSSWGVTIHNLAAAWGGIYRTKKDPAALAIARCRAGHALDVRTPAGSPHEWAMTTLVLSGIEYECFCLTGDGHALHRAERLARSAAPSLPRHQSAAALEQANQLAKEIARRRTAP